MQNGKSRIKRVASAIIAGVMALQTVAPVISYADDTASSVATTDDSDAIANVDPGTFVRKLLDAMCELRRMNLVR